MRYKNKIFFSSLIFLTSLAANAENLSQVYQDALVNDPIFRKAQADWQAAKQLDSLSLAGSGTPGTGVLPYVMLTGNVSQVSKKLSGVVPPDPSSVQQTLSSYQVTLTQPVFNLSNWLAVSSARYTVRAATAQYLAATQDLMNRVANAYFEVLRTNDKLKLTLTQKNQFNHQLDTAKQKFKVGLIAITGVYDAQAGYDRSAADEIRDRNQLQDRIEDLRSITGKKYVALAGLKRDIPLAMPQPQHILSWVRISLQQNYLIQADLNNLFAAREKVKAVTAAHLPTVNLIASYQGQSKNTSTPRTGTISGSINFPLIRGGFDIVNSRQSRYQYLSASDQLQIDYRSVESSTRQAYLGIASGVSEIGADQQAIISSRNQLKATKAGYVVGTRTMVDVLDSVTQLTQAQLAYANDRYNYVEGLFLLKQQAGTLAPKDIHTVNAWLGERVFFSLEQPSVKPNVGAQSNSTKLSHHARGHRVGAVKGLLKSQRLSQLGATKAESLPKSKRLQLEMGHSFQSIDEKTDDTVVSSSGEKSLSNRTIGLVPVSPNTNPRGMFDSLPKPSASKKDSSSSVTPNKTEVQLPEPA